MVRAKAADVPQTGFHFDTATHSYFLDGRPMTGCTTILGVLAKPALIGWAARMAVEHVKENFKFKLDKGFPSFDVEHFEKVLEEARTAHAKKRDKAADAGTDLHALVEEYVKVCIDHYGGVPYTKVGGLQGPVYTSAWEPILPFTKWAVTEGIRFIATEQRLYSKELWVAGTCDLIFEKDGKRYIGDIKTYKKIWDRVPLIQCAGYALMWEEMQGRGHDWIGDPEAKSPIDGYCVICLPKERAFNEAEDVLWSWDTEGDREAFLACVRLYRYLQQGV